MKYNNLIRSVVLTVLLVLFCATPQTIFSADIDYQLISTWESKKIIKSFPSVIYDEWVNRKVSGDNNLNMTTLSLLKEIMRSDFMEYTLYDLPVDVSFSLIAQTIDISKIIASGDVGSIIKKVEKESVNFAVSYLNDYFSKEKVKVSYGAIDVDYKTPYGNNDSVIQYIMLYTPTNNSGGKLVTRIYSSKPIIPPNSYNGYGLTAGFYNELSPGEKIPPFIVEISGEINKSELGEYGWNYHPRIDLIFSNNVPDFKLKPPTLVEKYIINPIQEKLKEIGSIFNFFGGSTEFVEVLNSDREDKEAINSELVSMSGGSNVIPASCSRNNLGTPLHNIIINEVAWMGTHSNASNEWIELKNISSRDINMKGWSLVDKTNQIDITFDDLLLKSGGFLLLERTSDNTVPFVNADLIYKGTLGNTDDELYLFNSNCGLEDYVSANPSWPSGNSAERRTMERAKNLEWQTYSGESYYNILGTPKRENSIKIEQKEEIKIKEEVKVTEEIKEEETKVVEEVKEEEVKVVEEIKEEKEEEIKEEIVIAYCSQVGTPSYSGIIINEVAWMGTTVGATKEWIELKNRSTMPINMKGWQLLDKDNQIKVIFDENDILAPGQIYLLERTSDDSVPNVIADKIYTGTLANSDESLRLFNSSCQLVDEVIANPSWPSGNSTERKTMERGADLTWHTSFSVNGSPKTENSQPTLISNNNNPNTTTIIYVSSPTPPEAVTYCSQVGTPSHSGIIINEVAWMGTTVGATKEWIELKNISDEEVLLGGWQLLSRDNRIKIVFDEDESIQPNQLYLLERTSDDSVPDVIADRIYTGALGNSDDLLMLFDDECQLVDEVIANLDWPAGNSAERKTMERHSDLSWYTSSIVNGTPKSENSTKSEVEEDEEEIENEEETENEEEIEDDEEIIIENNNDYLVISEMQANGENNLEYVELYNQSQEQIELCSNEDNCFYLSYFPPTFDNDGIPKYNWNNPYYNWKFLPGEIIDPGEYYLIVIYGDIEGDMIIKNEKGNPYSSPIINNLNGSFSLFNSNPIIDDEELSEEEKINMAKSFKVDVVAWGDNSLPVREGEVASLSSQGMSLGRKWLNGRYVDTDNNFNDFELQKPSPGEYCKQSPEKIEDIQIESFKNTVTLSWETPFDVDSSSEEINYEIYFSIDDADFKLLEEIEIVSEEDINSATIENLYYDRDHYFSIKAIDIDGNESEISQTISCKTEASDHIKPLLYGNYQKNNIFDIPYLSGEISAESLNTLIEQDYYSSQLSSNSLISDEEILYAAVSMSGSRKILAMKDDIILWDYNCKSFCSLIFLGKDGTIYFNDNGGIGALSPWGELRIKESFEGILSNTFTIDSQERIYFIDSENKVYGIEDNFNSMDIKNIYNLSDQAANLMTIDSSDNIYFASKNIIYKANFDQGKISEKAIEVDYHEDYEGEKDKTLLISGINIVSGDRVLINTINHYYDKEGNGHESTTLLSPNMEEVIWSKIDYPLPLAIGENQFYIWQNKSPRDSWWMVFYLYGVDLSTGDILWGKKTASTISISHVNYLIADKNNNIYFTQGSKLIGYNVNNITSEEPEEDRILEINLGETGSYFSVGREKIFFNFQKRIKSVQY